MAKDVPILDLSHPGTVQLLIRDLKSRKGLHSIEIHKLKDQRTLRQNAYYHGVVIPILREAVNATWGFNFDNDGMHHRMRSELLTVKVPSLITGELIDHVRSTTELTKEEFGEYLDKLIGLASSLGSTVPPPIRYEDAA